LYRYNAGARYSFVEPASADSLKGCGMSLGYMSWDLMVGGCDKLNPVDPIA
jgi:hypothetical protein